MTTVQNETVTGLLDWETTHEGRLRQWNNGPVIAETDPYIPIKLKEEVWLRYFGKVYEHKCYVHWCKNIINVFSEKITRN